MMIIIYIIILFKNNFNCYYKWYCFSFSTVLVLNKSHCYTYLEPRTNGCADYPELYHEGKSEFVCRICTIYYVYTFTYCDHTHRFLLRGILKYLL